MPAALPTCSWNEDLGTKRWERGSPPKKEWRVEKQQETRKTANQSWFRTSHDFKPKHTKVCSRNKREHLQNKIAIKKWTAHNIMDFSKTGFTTTQQGITKKKYIIQNEQLATVVLKFKPQVANTSEIKSTTIETCFLDKVKFHLRMLLTTSSVCSLSHVCLPAKISRPVLLVWWAWGWNELGRSSQFDLHVCVVTFWCYIETLSLFSRATQCLLSDHHFSPLSPRFKQISQRRCRGNNWD